jgi:hypothetical protein
VDGAGPGDTDAAGSEPLPDNADDHASDPPRTYPGAVGLKDTFRSLRGSGGRDRMVEEPIAGDLPAAMWFRPRTDGVYTDQAGVEFLRFLPNRRVLLLTDPATLDASSSQLSGAPSGEYTGGGRFAVQARFERPVVFAVPEPDVAPETPVPPGQLEEFAARRTDTRPGGDSTTVTYRFRPFTATLPGQPSGASPLPA